MTDPLRDLRDELRAFAAEREWDQFHSPRNLATALAVEAAELLEPFQWLTEEQSRALPPETRAAVEEEIADDGNPRLGEPLDKLLEPGIGESDNVHQPCPVSSRWVSVSRKSRLSACR